MAFRDLNVDITQERVCPECYCCHVSSGYTLWMFHLHDAPVFKMLMIFAEISDRCLFCA